MLCSLPALHPLLRPVERLRLPRGRPATTDSSDGQQRKPLRTRRERRPSLRLLLRLDEVFSIVEFAFEFAQGKDFDVSDETDLRRSMSRQDLVLPAEGLLVARDLHGRCAIECFHGEHQSTGGRGPMSLVRLGEQTSLRPMRARTTAEFSQPNPLGFLSLVSPLAVHLVERIVF